MGTLTKDIVDLYKIFPMFHTIIVILRGLCIDTFEK